MQGRQIFYHNVLLEHLGQVLPDQLADQLLEHVLQRAVTDALSGSALRPVPAVLLPVDDLENVVVETLDVVDGTAGNLCQKFGDGRVPGAKQLVRQNGKLKSML